MLALAFMLETYTRAIVKGRTLHPKPDHMLSNVTT